VRKLKLYRYPFNVRDRLRLLSIDRRQSRAGR